jgi:hypothetical protein
MQGGASTRESLQALRTREEEVAREWQWLNETINEVARVRADQGDAAAFRLLQQQTMRVGQRLEAHRQALERPLQLRPDLISPLESGPPSQ